MKHHTPHWHRGLHAIHFGFLGGLVAITFLGSLFVSVFSPLWIKPVDAAVSRFATGSFWDAPIPSYTDLHPSSASLAANIVSQVATYGAAITKDNGSSTVYEVDANTSTTSVIPYDCGTGIPSGLTSQWSAVPIPFYAVPSGSTGAEMTIYQPSSGTVWEFGHMRNVSGQWEACSGGKISTASSGVFAAPYGITSSGLAVLGGQISTQEITAGTINHVVGLNIPKTNGISWPATQYNGNYADAPAMGQRFRLDPSINVESLGLSSAAKAVARAGQTYGFVVWNTGGVVGFSAESPASATTRGLPDPYGGNSLSLSGFPWDKLQALPDNYGQAGGIPTITKFAAYATSISADTRVTLSWQATNVTRCAIGGVADNLAAAGSVQTSPLQADTIFVLRCSGPLGITTSQVNILVTGSNTSEFKRALNPGSLITEPYAGYANIFPDLISQDGVYKVVYYQNKIYIAETATPPFALNTLRLPNGPYTVTAKIYYRDGHTDQRVLGITVNNAPETVESVTQSIPLKAPATVPLAFGVIGGITALTMMGAGTWWGWRRAHLF